MDSKLYLTEERLNSARALDEPMMNLIFQDPNCVKRALNVVRERDDLKLVHTETQKSMYNLLGKAVRFDVFATDKEGNLYNIEVQRKREGATPLRGRYHLSVMDTNTLKAGDSYNALPDSTVIFITEKDPFNKGKAKYTVRRTNDYKDGQNIVYVNGEYEAGDEETELSHFIEDMRCANCEEMYYPEMRDRMRFLKNTKEGKKIMKKTYDDFWEEVADMAKSEGKAEGKAAKSKEVALNLLKKKYDYKEIVDISGCTREELALWAEEKAPEYK